MSIMAGGMRGMMELLDKLSVPQIQQGMKAGRYPAYLAIPAIELKTRMQKQFEQQRLLQQPSPKETPTVAERVMQEAQGVGSLMGAEIGAGVSGLPSNLPESYAPGGLVAFADGGEVERYAFGGDIEGTMDEPAADMGGGSDYAELVRRKAIEKGLDPNLMVRLAKTESAFDPTAVSPAGAKGLMQLMPATAKQYGLDEKDIFNPERNVDVGLDVFKDNLKKYGNPELAGIAYNWGPGNLDKHLQRYGGVNVAALPKETQGHRAKLGFSAGLPQPLAAALTSAMPVASATAAETPSAAKPRTKREEEAAIIQQLQEQGVKIDRGMIEDIRAGRFKMPEKETQDYFKGPEYGSVPTPTGMAGELGIPGFAGYPEMPSARVAPTARPGIAGPEPETAGIPAKVPGVGGEEPVAPIPQRSEAPRPMFQDIVNFADRGGDEVKNALDKAVAYEEKLNKMSEPGYKLIEERQAARQQRLKESEKSDAMNALMAFLSKTAGTRGHWATALAAGGEAMVDSLVKSEAARRSAQDKLDEAQDSLVLRKLADKKGDWKAAQEQSEKYADRVQKANELRVNARRYENEAIFQSYGLELKNRMLETGKEKLAILRRQAEAGILGKRAALLNAQTKAIQAWDNSFEKMSALKAANKEYGDDWMEKPKSEKYQLAMNFLNNSKRAFVENNMAIHEAMNTYGEGGITSGVRDVNELLSGI